MSGVSHEWKNVPLRLMSAYLQTRVAVKSFKIMEDEIFFQISTFIFDPFEHENCHF